MLLLGVGVVLIVQQIYTHPPQRVDRPRRRPFLGVVAKVILEEVPHKLGIAPLAQSLPDPAHQVQHVVHVVDGDQVRAHRLLGRQMVDGGAGDAEPAFGARAAGRAGAVLFERDVRGGVADVLEVDDAAGGDGVAEARGARGPDAVEHVGAEGHGDDDVFGVADAHDVAGLVGGEDGGARVDAAW